MRKLTVLLSAAILLLIFMQLSNSCIEKKTIAGEQALKNWYYQTIDTITQQLLLLDTSIEKKESADALKQQFISIRTNYKKVESIVEFYFTGLMKRINGPVLPDVKLDDSQVWPPLGFQVIEQNIFGTLNDSIVKATGEIIGTLITDLRHCKANMREMRILPYHFYQLVQHQFVRIASQGISGLDAPISKYSIIESSAALSGIREMTGIYYSEKKEIAKKDFESAINYLRQHIGFDDFNRMQFIMDYLLPVSKIVYQQTVVADSLPGGAFTGSFENWLTGTGYNPDYYATYAIAKSNAAKILLGKKLFFEKRLSSSGKISCGTCHRPELYLTDGKTKAADFIHGGSLARNTPTLYYAAMQSHQFYDMRSVTLEDQAHDVMKSSSEFNFHSKDIAKMLNNDTGYQKMFRAAFENLDSIAGYNVRNAIAAFVRSLSPFSSKFDEYVKGNKAAMNVEEINGFNLFMGKAKCGTCHFMPLFNGNIPPWYTKSESEIIGVPNAVVWKNARIDGDSGRYNINRIDELMFAFKTPTVRNIEKTAPYMHNGLYKNLEDVVEFYHKGGGAGLGMDLPFQSLPFDSLQLNKKEKQALISFMKTLTDKTIEY